MLATTKVQISKCCYAPIIFESIDGHGKCSDCKENTVPDEEEKTNKILELSTPKGRLREAQLVEYKGDEDCQVYSIIDTETVSIFYPSTDGACINVRVNDIRF